MAKASNIEHMRQNIDVFDFYLNEGEMKRIAAINKECSVYFGREGIRNPKVVQTTGGYISIPKFGERISRCPVI